MAILLFLFLYSVELLSARAFIELPFSLEGDEYSIVQTARLLPMTHSAAIPYTPGVVRGIEGKYFQKYGFFTSLLLAIPFWAGDKFARFGHYDRSPEAIKQLVERSQFLAVLLSSAFVPIMGSVIYLLLHSLGYSVSVSLIATLGLTLGAPVFVAGRTFLSEPLQALLNVGGMFLIWKALDKYDSKWWLVGLLLLCASTWTKPVNSLNFVPVALYLILKNNRLSLKYFGSFIMVGCLALGGILVWNQVRFGELFAFGYSEERDGLYGFGTPWWVGMYGFLFSSGTSLFLYSPILIIAVCGIKRIIENNIYVGFLFGSPFLIQMLLYSKWWAWHGAVSWGPRMLAATIPLLAPFLAEGLGSPILQKRWGKGVVVVLLLLSIGIQFLGMAFSPVEVVKGIKQEISVFKHPVFDAEHWPIRDDGLHLRFIPEFSPIVIHGWLTKVKLAQALGITPPEAPFSRLLPDWKSSFRNNPPHWNVLGLMRNEATWLWLIVQLMLAGICVGIGIVLFQVSIHQHL